MPVSWQPKTDKIAQLIEDEEIRLELLRAKKLVTARQFTLQPVEMPTWQPQVPAGSVFQPSAMTQQVAAPEWLPRTAPYIPRQVTPFIPQPVQLETPQPQPVVPAEKEEQKPVSVPFWQRAMQVFAAPFEWVDNYVIKPALAVGGTAVGFVPEVERQPGEDYWEWKKRSWEGWEAPGIELSVPWRKEPVRIDVKGVMEFAPWLLIPGAGQIGGAVAKLGKVGKVLGMAIQYSPWGIVEKTAGAAIKGTLKGVSKATGKIETRVFGEIPKREISPVVQEFTQMMEAKVVPKIKEWEVAKKEILRPRQALGADEYLEKVRMGEIEFSVEGAMAARQGELKSGFVLSPEDIAWSTPEKVGELRAIIDKAVESDVHKNLNAQIALNEMLLLGKLPEPAIIKTWASVFGEDFAKVVFRLRGVKPSAFENFVDALNIPRSLLASWDASATFRQGLFFSILHPTQVPVWFGRQIKSLLSEKLGLEMDDALRARPHFATFQKLGVDFTDIRRPYTASQAEEFFASRAGRLVPGVRRSERAFTTYMNESRYATMEAGYNAMVAQGATDAELKLFARFVNLAGGRGEIPKSLDRFMPAFNLALFSPRLQAATLQLPKQIGRMLLSDNPYMRKEAAKALATFVGGGATLVTLLNLSGRGKVEIDPRSGDFGKIKIGETRLDIWRGYVQYARFVSQLLTGERKSAYGNMNKTERSEIAWRFLQSKASPAFGLMVDLLRGETYMGDPIFNDTTGFIKAAKEKLVPLALQDIIDAMESQGVNGLAISAPALLGIGTLTYINDFVKVKNKIAKDTGYETWDEIDPASQRRIENTNTELQVAQIQFDRQVMGTAWGDWRQAGKAVEEGFREAVDMAVAEYRTTGEGYQFNEKITKAFQGRRGAYDAREREERFADIVKRLKVQDPVEAMVNLGPEQMAIKTYNDALFGDGMYDEFGNYRFEEAQKRKDRLRLMLGEEMYKYVEDYRDIKFETFPTEFQELMRAKEMMRPYWDVRNRVIRLFGERFADSSRGRALISKRRKQMRSANPTMNTYYQMFYASQ